MIIIYTTNWCPYCVSAKNFIKEHDIAYKEINIEEEKISRSEMQNITGQYTVPQIIINNKCIGGYQDLLRLYQNKQLKELINEWHW